MRRDLASLFTVSIASKSLSQYVEQAIDRRAELRPVDSRLATVLSCLLCLLANVFAQVNDHLSYVRVFLLKQSCQAVYTLGQLRELLLGFPLLYCNVAQDGSDFI